MKTLQMPALMLALSVCSIGAHAQQEIDPDHFDRPAATRAAGANAVSHHKTASAHHGNNAKLAAKHSRSARHQHDRHSYNGEEAWGE